MQENFNKALLTQALILGVILYIIVQALESISVNAIDTTPLMQDVVYIPFMGNTTLMYAIQLAIIGIFAFIAGFIAPVGEKSKRYRALISPFLVVIGLYLVSEILRFIATVSYDSAVYHDVSTSIADFMQITEILFMRYLIIALLLGGLGVVLRRPRDQRGQPTRLANEPPAAESPKATTGGI